MGNSEVYFDQKYNHSEIKHKIFQDTFLTVLNIAEKYSRRQEEGFIYCDLYAGQGEFDDGKAGSPSLALETIERSCKELSNLTVQCVFIEKDSETSDTLWENLEKRAKNLDCQKIRHPIIIGRGPWQKHKERLNNALMENRWGFVFVDPFHNEVDLDLLKKLIKTNYLKDVMLFVNLQALRREAGSKNTREKVASFLGINHRDLEITQSRQRLMEVIREKMRLPNKQYNLLVSLPNSRNGELVNNDYFALLLSTNSIGVADAFVKSYGESLRLYKNGDCCGLFGGESLADKLLEVIGMVEKTTLKDLYIKVVNSYFASWRRSDLAELPVTNNIHSAVNRLLQTGKIVIVSAEPSLLMQKNNIAILRKKAVQRNENMQSVVLCKK